MVNSSLSEHVYAVDPGNGDFNTISNLLSTTSRELKEPVSANTGKDDEQRALSEAFRSISDLREFLITAPARFSESEDIMRFRLPTEEEISCVRWKNYFYITGTDIVRSVVYRFSAFGREIINRKKFEEGIFSDLRNLKINHDAVLEPPKSKLLEFLYKHHCVRTKKKQKVFFWCSVHHDRLFIDALERELKKEVPDRLDETSSTSSGIIPTSAPSTKAVREPALSFKFDSSKTLRDQIPDIVKTLPNHIAAVVNATITVSGESTDSMSEQNDNVQRPRRPRTPVNQGAYNSLYYEMNGMYTPQGHLPNTKVEAKLHPYNWTDSSKSAPSTDEVLYPSQPKIPGLVGLSSSGPSRTNELGSSNPIGALSQLGTYRNFDDISHTSHFSRPEPRNSYTSHQWPSSAVESVEEPLPQSTQSWSDRGLPLCSGLQTPHTNNQLRQSSPPVKLGSNAHHYNYGDQEPIRTLSRAEGGLLPLDLLKNFEEGRDSDLFNSDDEPFPLEFLIKEDKNHFLEDECDVYGRRSDRDWSMASRPIQNSRDQGCNINQLNQLDHMNFLNPHVDEGSFNLVNDFRSAAIPKLRSLTDYTDHQWERALPCPSPQPETSVIFKGSSCGHPIGGGITKSHLRKHTSSSCHRPGLSWSNWISTSPIELTGPKRGDIIANSLKP